MEAKGYAVLHVHIDSFRAALVCNSINVNFNMKLVCFIISHPTLPPIPQNFKLNFPSKSSLSLGFKHILLFVYHQEQAYLHFEICRYGFPQPSLES